MAVRTSSQSGNTASAPFAFGTAVNSGDRLICNHAVNHDGTDPVGDSPPVTPNGAASFGSTIAATGGGSVTNLSTGTRRACYTNVDSGGKESSRSPTMSPSGTITNGVSQPRMTLPALPTGVTSRNVYLSDAGGAAGTERLYATGVTGTTFDPVDALFENNTVAFASATPVPDASAINVNAGGSFTVPLGATLVCRGDIRGNGAPITVAGTLEFDASASVGTTNTYYRLVLGTGVGTNSAATLTLAGTIRSNAGGGNGAIGTLYDQTSGLLTNSGLGTASGFTLQRLGSSTRHAWDVGPNGTVTISLTNGTIDACGAIYHNAALTNASNLTVSGNIFLNSLDTTNGNVRVIPSAPSTGLRVLSGNNFDKTVIWSTAQDATITGNVFRSGFAFNSGIAASFSGNVCVVSVNTRIPGSPVGNYFFSPLTADNAHYIDPPAGFSPWLVTDNIFQHHGTASPGLDTGDCISGLPVTSDVTIERNLVLYGENDIGSGTILTVFGGSNTLGNVLVQHNTIYTSKYNLSLNEGATTIEAGAIRYRSNLLVRRAASDPIYMCYTFGVIAGLADDYLLEANFNASAGTRQTGANVTNGYLGKFSYTPGVDDIYMTDEAAVGFVAAGRDLGAWGATFYATDGSSTAALDVLSAAPALVATMIAWVKSGYAPTNPAVRNAGHDGVTIGAFEGVWASAPEFVFQDLSYVSQNRQMLAY